MQMKKIILIVVLLLVAVVACLWWINKKDKNEQAEDKFVKVVDGHFQRNGKPYYYVGTNFWYGAILGSEGRGGNRELLCQELDDMKAMGIDNLRILVGMEWRLRILS